LQKLLAKVFLEGPVKDFQLEVAKEQRRSLLDLAKRLLPILFKRVDKRSSLCDYVFLTFLENRLSVRVPKVMYGIWGQGHELVPSGRVISLLVILGLVIVSVPILNRLPVSSDIDLGTKSNKVSVLPKDFETKSNELPELPPGLPKLPELELAPHLAVVSYKPGFRIQP